MSAPDEPIKGHCPNCGPDRQTDVVAHHHTRDDDDGVWGTMDYRILRCRGCHAIFFQIEDVFSENYDYKVNRHTGEYETYIPSKFTYWPAPSKRPKPDWSFKLRFVDSDLDSLFDDIYVALNSDLHVLSAIGIRTVFDRASELLNVQPKLSFAEKLAELEKTGKIGRDERTTLDTLTNAGSAAAHRGWKPKPSELNTMMAIIEAFLYRNFILESAIKELKQSVPARQRPRKRKRRAADT